jgi:hypothetical protein
MVAGASAGTERLNSGFLRLRGIEKIFEMSGVDIETSWFSRTIRTTVKDVYERKL